MAEMLMEDQRILVVEDEYVVAEAIERALTRAGAIVLGPVPSVDQAMALLDRGGRIDSAILDINLGEQKVYPVVDRLLAQGVRCIFATGNDITDVPSDYKKLLDWRSQSRHRRSSAHSRNSILPSGARLPKSPTMPRCATSVRN